MADIGGREEEEGEGETDFGVADPFRESAVRGFEDGRGGSGGGSQSIPRSEEERGDRRWLDEDGGSISRRVEEEDRDETMRRGREREGEKERERIGGRVGELGSSGMVLNLAQVSGSWGPSIFESSINSKGNSIPVGYICIVFLLSRSLLISCRLHD